MKPLSNLAIGCALAALSLPPLSTWAADPSASAGVGDGMGLKLPPVRGWYAGGALSFVGLHASWDRTNDTIGSTGATAFSANADHNNGQAWKAFAGYRYSPNLSAEATYWDFGRLTYTANISAPVVTSMQRSFRGKGAGADIVGWLPIGRGFTGFAKAGALWTRVDASSATPGGGLTALPEESAKKFNLHLGVGAEYALRPDVGLRVEYETVNKIGDNSKFGSGDLYFLSVGADYKF
jgi:opacity protein-like surface antigen